MLVKGTGSTAALIALSRDVIGSVEPGTFVDQVATLDALVSRATTQARFASRVLTAFGMLALVLAAVGIHGTLSYVVGSRTREIGIRLSLGAPSSQSNRASFGAG